MTTRVPDDNSIMSYASHPYGPDLEGDQTQNNLDLVARTGQFMTR